MFYHTKSVENTNSKVVEKITNEIVSTLLSKGIHIVKVQVEINSQNINVSLSMGESEFKC